ncbi:hypothetical protein Q73A0000_05125 [Kaistella flava (ex Peng et al. 2021)]|uniref:Uncharacterized protein n=1 Tax=Kaistella flava (ex Peng et al. 2021) TaxID=2038776 RepID=A0A7M2Y8R7_9FLAO|nr:hypothetical protein [Kaistella flava (ex Peng et al. 2021)]QOW09792.1 hypothetical protein Q73A0000_05125 [Kaistella flava (ex Peng et al. 2021)]
METTFVQWAMGQFLIVNVKIPEKYYVEIEVIYPYPGIKGEYFTDADDLHDENNFWIIRNLIFRVSQGYFYFSRFASDSLHDKAKFLNHESTERCYHRFVWKSIDEEVRFEWWADDDMKFFSKRTIENITLSLKHFILTKQSSIADIYEYEDRDITLRKMRNLITEQNCDHVYIYIYVMAEMTPK